MSSYIEIDDEKIGTTSPCTSGPKQAEQQVHTEQLQIMQHMIVQKNLKRIAKTTLDTVVATALFHGQLSNFDRSLY